MREFVVSLRAGKRYVVRAERVVLMDNETLALVRDPATVIGDQNLDPVALFDRRQVLSVIATDHLVSEADVPDVVAADPDADIPF